MKIFRSIDTIANTLDGCVLTIGNYDAVHIGHREILRQLVSVGKDLNLPVVVMTFAPSPEEYFQKDRAAPRLTTISSRYFALRDQGVDMMLALPFRRSLAQTSAEDFIRKYLVEGLKSRYILIGDDFRFGQGRKGDFQLLKNTETEYGFNVEQFATVKDEKDRVSSTRIRNALARGDLDTARKLLGRAFSMTGRVVHGDKRGREWGFPTANLAIDRALPMSGVFAVKVYGASPDVTYGVANLGKRPTIGGMKTLLEAHLFDYNLDLYGSRICVEFINKIRDEKKFESFDELKNQILRDCETARSIFKISHITDG